jgi:hypothetical protein
MEKDNLKNETPNSTRPMLGTVSFKMICANCMDFDAENNTCTIRYLIHKDKTKSPMPRKPNQKGCQVFMQK